MDILFTENIKPLPGHVDEEELDREKSKLLFSVNNNTQYRTVLTIGTAVCRFRVVFPNLSLFQFPRQIALR